MVDAIIYTGGTNELRYDNSLCAVDYKGTRVCHQRQISHKDLMLVDFVLILVNQTNLYSERCRIRSIAFLALLNCIFFLIFAELVIHKLQTQMTGKILNRRDIIKSFLKAVRKEPLVGVFLNLDQVWHLENFFALRECHSDVFAVSNDTHLAFFH